MRKAQKSLSNNTVVLLLISAADPQDQLDHERNCMGNFFTLAQSLLHMDSYWNKIEFDHKISQSNSKCDRILPHDILKTVAWVKFNIY